MKTNRHVMLVLFGGLLVPACATSPGPGSRPAPQYTTQTGPQTGPQTPPQTGPQTAPQTPAGKRDLVTEARNTLSEMQAADASLSLKMQSSYANIVFPKVGQGGFVLGGEWGRGVVFRNGQVIGYASLKAASVGLQAGGQTFDELVLIENAAALDRLVNQGVSLTSQAEGTVLKSGAAAQTNFRDGTAVLIKPVGGMMGNLSLGGQSISFVNTTEAQNKGW